MDTRSVSYVYNTPNASIIPLSSVSGVKHSVPGAERCPNSERAIFHQGILVITPRKITRKQDNHEKQKRKAKQSKQSLRQPLLHPLQPQPTQPIALIHAIHHPLFLQSIQQIQHEILAVPAPDLIAHGNPICHIPYALEAGRSRIGQVDLLDQPWSGSDVCCGGFVSETAVRAHRLQQHCFLGVFGVLDGERPVLEDASVGVGVVDGYGDSERL